MEPKKLHPVHTPGELLDIAFRHASREARKIKHRNRLIRKKRAEERRVKETGKIVIGYLSKLDQLRDWIDSSTAFQSQLFDITVGIERTLKTLDRVRWAKKTISKLDLESRRNIRTGKSDPVFLRKEFYGKTASILGKIKGELEFIGFVVASLKDFPTIKEGFTVVIAGMPNVGKSSLLQSLTSSKPEIKPYPFTTKGILVGYHREGFKETQIIDTPGVLDRPMARRNPIERQAVLAIKELADLVLFVLDPSETCGYTLDSQLKLYAEINEAFENVVPVVGKADLVDKTIIRGLEKQVGQKLLLSSVKEDRIEEIQSLLISQRNKASTRDPRRESTVPR